MNVYPEPVKVLNALGVLFFPRSMFDDSDGFVKDLT